ncbi:tyrosine-protein phosphatase [Alkalithermobacter paradoxus]|uniref:protein-tyrosine-phosphatase n=1 Tax=Alkalithermobacter paradoxus TaxID=29349 RepID=A0A1V4I5T3_9FIRM|nr:tyrosine-protein phosphatase YwqE [[Clostridium] thermoalcaliphilum]
MIDIHCHIIHNVDDGSSSIEESIEMAKIAERDGIKKIINTSHYHLYSHYVTGKSLEEKVNEFNKLLQEKNIDVKVYVGNELYYSKELISKLDKLDYYSLNNSKYVLIEFPPDNLPKDMEDIIYEFKIRNYIPILAHIERYSEVIDNPNLASDYINQGALIQVNASSILGKLGREIQSTCKILLQNNCIHFVASDAHGSKKRTPRLKESYNYIKDIIGKEKADKIFFENTQAIIENKDIQITKPIKHEKKSIMKTIKSIFIKGR